MRTKTQQKSSELPLIVRELANIKRLSVWITAVVFITTALIGTAQSQNVVKKGERSFERDRLFSDTIFGGEQYTERLHNSERIYDSIYNSKSKFLRFLAPLLITSPSNSEDANLALPTLEVGRHYYARYNNLTITEISIIQANIFERIGQDEITGIGHFMDEVHTLTRERQIKQNLLFKVGDKISPYKMSINEELLRSLPFVAVAYIVVEPNRMKPDEAVVKVFVRDSWTISADAAWFGNYYVSVFDKNFLGTGNELKLQYNFPMEGHTDGVAIEYNINNAFGTFTDLTLEAGMGYTDNKLKARASRKFILPSDHIWGFTAGYEQYLDGLNSIQDTTLIIKRSEYGAWYGYSLSIDPNQGTTLYATTGVDKIDYDLRPEVEADLNPYYHNRTTALVNLGVSRQNFFQGNMIYGYGKTEDIPFGYKFEVTGGYEWGEFSGKRSYFGALAAWGDLIGSSYLNARVAYGSYYNEDGVMEQGALNSYLNFFSPLFRMGSFYIRQFFYGTATWGFNRKFGEKEQLSFNDLAKVRGMWASRQNSGTNRLTLGTESVIFTPLILYNFRFAFYLWGDVGFMGYNPAIFNNPLSSAAGIGVRIKNERLIFNNIQLRLGFCINRPAGMGFESFSISNEKELLIENYRPETPTVVDYY